MYQLPPLNWLRAFEAAARHESFTAAAKDLSRTPKAVSYQVRALETHLGLPLFERMPQGLELTDMGRAYLPSVRKAFEDLSCTTAGLFGPVASQPITLRVTMAFSLLWLTPRLLEFRKAYPQIDIRLRSAIWTDALPSDHLDCEIRLGDGQWPGYRVDLLTTESAVPACSEQTYKNEGPYETAADLRGRELIHVMGQESLWMRLLSHAEVDPSVSRSGVTVDTALHAIELAAHGNGHAMLLRSYIASPLVQTRLKILEHLCLSLEDGPQHGHYLLMPDDAKETHSDVLLFREWLLDSAASWRGAHAITTAH